jgi:uncharacterized membrane protein YraQ (UPF0718 family)
MLDFAIDVLRQSADFLVDSSLYLLFGFLIAGLIHVWFPQDKIIKHFGGRDLRSVFKAGLFGIPLPLCSCAVVPTAITLRRKGASPGATMAFLISTPETGIDSLGISLALLDPLMAIFRPLAGVATALAAGIGINILDRYSEPTTPVDPILPENAAEAKCSDGCGCADDSQRGSGKNHLNRRLQQILKFSYGELLDDIAVWFILGLVLAALISVLVPDDFFARNWGSGLFPMLAMLMISVPLYTCATASTPIAAALILKGLSPGAALVFLLAGPATNLTMLVMLTHYFEKRFIVLYLITIAVASLALGGLLNLIYSYIHLDIRTVLGRGSEFLPGWLEIGAAFVLGLLLLRSLYKTRAFPRLFRYIHTKTVALLGAMMK